MNKIFLVSLALSSILTSCGQKPTPINSEFKNKIVLGAYSDMTSESTLNESELADLPKLIDLKDEMSLAKNQGDRGNCSFFTAIALIEGTIKKDLGKEVNLSEEYLIYATKNIGRYTSIEGSEVSANISGMKAKGLLLEEDWAYQASWFEKGRPCEKYKSTDTNAPAICFSHNKPNTKALSRLIDARAINIVEKEKNTNEIIRFLAEEKRPLIISVNVNFNAWPKSGDTDFSEEQRQECITDPSVCGGHSILITGYDMKKRVFMFKNSWGTEWGKNGYGTIPFDVVDNYVDGYFYYAKVNGKIKFPAKKGPDLKLNKFEVKTVTAENKSVYVVVDADVAETSGKMLYISSYLVKKSKNYVAELPSDGNVELVSIALDEQEAAGSEYVKTSTVMIPREGNQIVINSADGAALLLTAQMMSVPSIDAVLGNANFDKYLRTTIYVHTDDSLFKVLKRIYTPIQ